MSLVTLIKSADTSIRDAVVQIEEWALPKEAVATGKVDEAGRAVFSLIKEEVAKVAPVLKEVESDVKPVETEAKTLVQEFEADVKKVVVEVETEIKKLITEVEEVFQHSPAPAPAPITPVVGATGSGAGKPL